MKFWFQRNPVGGALAAAALPMAPTAAVGEVPLRALASAALLLGTLVGVLVFTAAFTLVERKTMALLQRREGPDRVGFEGLGQPFADGLKVVRKETAVPKDSPAHRLFFLSPVLSLWVSLSLWALLPWGPAGALCNSEVGLLLVLGLGSLGSYGVIYAGWASNNKYALMGALRAVAQFISFEIVFAVALLPLVGAAGSTSLVALVLHQELHGWFAYLVPLWALTFVLLLAEANRTPFDLPEAEAELVSGFNVEYSALLFAFFVRRFTPNAVAPGTAGGPRAQSGGPTARPRATPRQSLPPLGPMEPCLPCGDGDHHPSQGVKHLAYRTPANGYGTTACQERRRHHTASSYRTPLGDLSKNERRGTPRYWARQTNPFHNYPGGPAKPHRRCRAGTHRCDAPCGCPSQKKAGSGKAPEPTLTQSAGRGGPKVAVRAVFGGNAGSAEPPKGWSRRNPRSSIPRSAGSPRPQRGRGPSRTLATGSKGAKGGREYQWPISGATALETLATLQPIEAYGPENPLPDLRPLVCHPEVLYAAYGRLRSKPGNLTPAVGSETLDGMKAEYLEDLSRRLSTGAFTFSPARRKSIPKPSGGERPLTIASPRDKIVQEALRAVLEPLFEPTFSDHSHGFRPGRGCHSALREIHLGWRGVSWFLEVDIERCFDTIDHSRLMNLLQQRGLTSGVVTRLLWQGLRSRVVELDSCRRLREGTPQGSVLSPLLANIYLDQIDRWLEERVGAYNRGGSRVRNLEYRRRQYRIRLAPNRRERRRLRGLLQKSGLVPLIMDDPGFRRMRWVRYADDILIGVAGPRSEVTALRDELGVFLGTLGLRLSPTKTLITPAYPAQARFLGHRIGCTPLRRAPHRSMNRRAGRIVSRLSPRPVLYGDVMDLVLRLEKRGYCRKGMRGVPTRVGRLVYLPEAMIVQHFRTLFLSLANYYSGATNFTTVRNRLGYILRYSCARTLGAKLRLRTRRKVFNRFGPDLVIRDPAGRALASFPASLPKGLRKGFAPKGPSVTAESKIEVLTRRVARVRKLLEDACALCGSSEELEVHHIRKLSPRPAGRPKKGTPKPEPGTYATEMMRRMNRKQITLCAPCHRQVHRGAHDGPALAKMAKPL